MSLEVQSGLFRIQLHEVSHSVTDLCPDLAVSRILEPDLDNLLLLSKRNAHTDDWAITEVFSNESEEEGLPHQIDVCISVDFVYPNAAIWTLLPHGNFTIPHEK